jgi:hypothetical protein
MLNIKKSKTLDFIFRDIHLIGLSRIPNGDLRGQNNIYTSKPGCANASALGRFPFFSTPTACCEFEIIHFRTMMEK